MQVRTLREGYIRGSPKNYFKKTIPRTATTIPTDKNNSFQKAVPPNGSNNSAKNTFRSPRCHFTHGGYHTVVPSLDNELWGRESTTHCVHWLFIWFGACPSNPVTAACSLSFEFQVPHCHIISSWWEHTRHGRLLAPHHDVPHRPRFRDAYL